jgi:hypothetical protein
VLVFVWAACVTTVIDEPGIPVWESYPFDGQRSWTYRSEDPSVAYELVASSSGEPVVVDGVNTYLVETHQRCLAAGTDCEDGLLYTTTWSSQHELGVHVHAVDGQPFEPPIQLSIDAPGPGQRVETEVDGQRWSSELGRTEPCPVVLDANWHECLVLEVQTDGEGFPVAGRWWSAPGNGVAAFLRAGEQHVWQLSALSCEGECDGTW